MKKIFVFLIRFYQYTFSAILGGQCRFHPTCSEYAVECFEHLPPHRAFILTLWRILRCQPFAKGGYDPVRWDAPGTAKDSTPGAAPAPVKKNEP